MTLVSKIEPDRCGCDMEGGSASLVSVDEALRRIARHVAPVQGTEGVSLGSAAGRILAKPVTATAVTPPFDNSAMDGYAVDSRALLGAGPWRLPVVQRIRAGDAVLEPLLGPTSARIFTGARVPPGADAVVPQERVVRDGDRVLLQRRPTSGANIRRAGSDMRPGQIVLEAGARLGVRESAAAAAAGVAEVEIRRALRIGLLVTGNEIRQAGSGRASAEIWDVNTPMLSLALSGPETALVAVRQAVDDPMGLQRHLADLAGKTDLIVTTGGISVGEEDHVKPALAALGAEIHFSGVAMKPGKPVSFGRFGQAVWLGLPGNPLSAFVTWQVFGRPLLDFLLGAQRGSRKRRHVVIGKPVRRRPGRCEFRPARVVGFDGQGREVVTFEDRINSAAMAGLPAADGLVLIPAETEEMPEGALAEFLPF